MLALASCTGFAPVFGGVLTLGGGAGSGISGAGGGGGGSGNDGIGGMMIGAGGGGGGGGAGDPPSPMILQLQKPGAANQASTHSTQESLQVLLFGEKVECERISTMCLTQRAQFPEAGIQCPSIPT